MNATQRKWHGLVWLVIILFMPTTIFLSIRNLNFSKLEQKGTSRNYDSTSNALSIVENDIIKLLQHKNSLEIILKKTLKYPTTLVYEINKDGKKGKLIGQLTTSGRYKFDIDQTPKGVMLFDSIKQSKITQLLF